jgi:transcriptional repressor NrdR
VRPSRSAEVIAGVRKACSGRPVDEDALAVLAQQVEETVRSIGAAEVPAHDVGLAILGPLRDLDEVAYMRFASVYRGFESLDDFEGAINELRAYQELAESAAYGPTGDDPTSEPRNDAMASVPRYGGAHDPAPPPVIPASAGR